MADRRSRSWVWRLPELSCSAEQLAAGPLKPDIRTERSPNKRRTLWVRCCCVEAKRRPRSAAYAEATASQGGQRIEVRGQRSEVSRLRRGYGERGKFATANPSFGGSEDRTGGTVEFILQCSR
jgi:hypothetical protein